MIDIHSHVLFGIDDGATTIEMSMDMLRSYIAQGVHHVFCTSHSRCSMHRYEKHFAQLQQRIAEEQLPICIYKGCEVECSEEEMPEIIEGINNGFYPTLNGSKYVLVEFEPYDSADTILNCIRYLKKHSAYIPIIAHIERYRAVRENSAIVSELRELSCFFQVNAYSLKKTNDEEVKSFARSLIQKQMVDFLGSDAHRSNHRPPEINDGIEYLIENHDADYSAQIAYNNAHNLLIPHHTSKRKCKSIKHLEKIRSVVYGHAIGDALGVPVEFSSRTSLQQNPVTGMRGYGTHNMPAGTWSDDTSMALATMDSLARGVNYEDTMVCFCNWMENDAYTATDEMFDIGGTTSAALYRFLGGTPALECGKHGESDNGNGSLMRIYPVVLYTCLLHQDDYTMKQMLELIHNYSALTHAHPRSMIGCGIYTLVLNSLLHKPKKSAVQSALQTAKNFYSKSEYAEVLHHYSRLFDDNFATLPETEIQSGGYVVHALEASIWCLLNSDSYEECVLKAVNLGRDADTTAAITGSLAVAMYGLESIPAQWMDTLLKKDLIEEICQRFCSES